MDCERVSEVFLLHRLDRKELADLADALAVSISVAEKHIIESVVIHAQNVPLARRPNERSGLRRGKENCITALHLDFESCLITEMAPLPLSVKSYCAITTPVRGVSIQCCHITMPVISCLDLAKPTKQKPHQIQSFKIGKCIFFLRH